MERNSIELYDVCCSACSNDKYLGARLHQLWVSVKSENYTGVIAAQDVFALECTRRARKEKKRRGWREGTGRGGNNEENLRCLFRREGKGRGDRGILFSFQIFSFF